MHYSRKEESGAASADISKGTTTDDSASSCAPGRRNSEISTGWGSGIGGLGYDQRVSSTAVNDKDSRLYLGYQNDDPSLVADPTGFQGHIVGRDSGCRT